MVASVAAGLAAIAVIGAAAQWLGWRLQLPSILLLLVFGFLAGPEVGGIVEPDALFGDLFQPFVSIAVAVLLFEGSLTLTLRELGEYKLVVFKLVTLGAAVVVVLAGTAAIFLLDFDPALALLLGAILTVTGPTVVIPLLRQVRPTGSAGAILKWEGILIDPLGAVFAVLVFEGIVDAGAFASALDLALWGIGKTLLFGGVSGAVGAWVLVELLRHYWVPDHLHSPTALALAIGVFAAANAFQHEAGLFSVTLMGALLANQKRVDLRHILEFKENLQVLLIAALFILLAARVRIEQFGRLHAGAFVFLAFLILVVRPVAVWLCTIGGKLGTKTRIYIAAMAPRGVVAAAVTAVFALRLEATGYAGADALLPVVFLVIVGTVAVYGLSAGPLAHRLGLATPDPQGVLVIGASRLAREVALQLKEAGLRVLLADTNARAIKRARLMGLEVFYGNVLSEHSDEEIDLAGIGRLFAMTPNDEVNALAALHFVHLMGRSDVLRLAPTPEKGKGGDYLSPHLRARILFGKEYTYDALNERLRDGAEIRATKLTDEFGFAQWRDEHGDDAIPLMTIDRSETVTVGTVDKPLDPKPGDTLVALVDAA